MRDRDKSGASSTASAPGAVSTPNSPRRPFVLGPAPASSPAKERETAVLAIMTGLLAAKDLPELASEPGRGLDLDLRDELTPRAGVTSRVGALSVRGGLSPASAKQTLEAARLQLQGCYERSLARDPRRTGRIELELALGSDGRVSDAKTKRSTFESSDVVRCVVVRSQSLQFAAGDAGSSTLSFVISFASG
ncbi:MAG: AgmX/PglI C-terminal domain-containing protein [Myxococcales bacterium]|nr:AgmX/PglI C-terminal domain-containing protein [Myxococcales bacterium]